MMYKIKINIRYFFVLLYLIIIFFYLFFFVKPVLFYQAQQPAFLCFADFFHYHSVYPGGISDYVSLFLMQFFYFNWSGALTILALAWAIAHYSFLLVKRIYQMPAIIYFVKYLPVLLILYLINDYYFPISVLTRLLIVIIALNIFQLLSIKFNIKIIVLLLLDLILFYVAGGPSMFLFTICAIILLLKGEHSKKALIASAFTLIFAALVPYIAYKYIFIVSLVDLYKYILPESLIMLKYHYSNYYYILFGYIPLFQITFLFFKTKTKEPNSLNADISTNHVISGSELSWLKKHGVITVQFFILLGITIGLFHSLNRHEKYVLLSDYYAEREEWGEVIKNAMTSPDYDVQINRDFNRALYHNDELLEKMFTYPQLSGFDGLFTDGIEDGDKEAISNCELYFDLGFISQSQHWALEAQVHMPYNPRILKKLAINSIILEDYKQTDKFLKVLERNFLYHKWVEKYREFLSDTMKITNDQFIQYKKTLNPDSGLMDFPMERNLYLLMQRNNTNKMAFEYIAAFYLLNQKLEEFYHIFPHTPEFGYKKIPRSFEEALLFYRKVEKNKLIDLPKQYFSENSLNNMEKFTEILRQYKGDINVAKYSLKNSFSDTYWYYIFYIKPIPNTEIKNKTKTY